LAKGGVRVETWFERGLGMLVVEALEQVEAIGFGG